MAGIDGAITSAVSSTSATLPTNNLTVIGADVYAATASGYLSIVIDATRNAIFPMTAQVGVTTTDVAGAAIGPWHFTLKTSGNALNYAGVGLTSGTFIFYYGSPFERSLDYKTFAGVAVSFTTGTSLSFTFPSGDIHLTGMSLVIGSSTLQTATYFQEAFNTTAGRSITVTFAMTTYNGPQDRPFLLLNNLGAAQTLTVTQTITTTHVGTGYLVIYFV